LPETNDSEKHPPPAQATDGGWPKKLEKGCSDILWRKDTCWKKEGKDVPQAGGEEKFKASGKARGQTIAGV